MRLPASCGMAKTTIATPTTPTMNKPANVPIPLYNPIAMTTTDTYNTATCACEHSAIGNNVIIPNAFSPNCDGINDILKALGNNMLLWNSKYTTVGYNWYLKVRNLLRAGTASTKILIAR